MGLQTITGGAYLPNYWITSFAYSFSAMLLQSTTTIRTALIGIVPKTGTLDTFEFCASFVSSPSDVKFSFQDVDASGNPDGTPDQYRVLAGGSLANGWVSPGLITSDGTDGGTKRAVTAGDVLALVLEWDSTQSGEFWINRMSDGSNGLMPIPYALTHNGSAWTKTVTGYQSLILKYNDGTYAGLSDITAPFTAVNTRSINTGSTPDEIGLLFSLPAPVRVGGAWVGAAGAATADLDIVLYDSDGSSVLASFALDASLWPSPPTTAVQVVRWAPVNLAASTSYRLVVKPTTANNVSLYTGTVSAAAITGALGGGTWHRTERTDAGSWTETTTERPFMGLIVTALEEGTGGSAGGAWAFA